MVFRGLIRLGFWSGMAYASYAIHWWHQLGPGWLRGMDTAAVAVPSSGDAPVSGVWTSLGLGYVCKRSRGSPRCIPRERVKLEVRAGSTATGGGDAARRSMHMEIPVQCRVGVGEEEVDGAPDSKAKPWRRLVVAERRRNSGITAALSSVPAMARRRCWRSGWRLQSGEVGCRGRGGLIKDGTGVWACVHGAIAAEIAAAQDAEETDRATISRDPGLGWGSFWKLSAHGRLSSGSCRAGWSTAQRASVAETAQRGRREVCGRRKGKQLTCGPA